MLRSAMRWFISTLVVSLLFIANAYGADNSKKITNAVTFDTIRALEEKIQELREVDIAILNSQFNWLRDAIPSGNAYLNCDSSDYNILQSTSNFVLLFVSCEDVLPYLEGYKIKLKIGNPYSVAFEGAKLSLNYGTGVSDSVLNKKEGV